MPEPGQGQRVSLLPVFLIVLVDVFGMTLVIPLLAIYAETFHATALQATMLVSVYAACQLVSGPMIGHLSDRVGRKPMLLISQFGTFVGFLVMAIGIMLVFQPLVVIADVLPILGNFLGMGIALFAGVTAAGFSLLTIGIAWIYYRPVPG